MSSNELKRKEIPRLELPGIAYFKEEGAIRLSQAEFLCPRIIVRIPQKDHRSWIQPVGKKKLGKEILIFRIDRKRIVIDTVAVINVLKNGPHEYFCV